MGGAVNGLAGSGLVLQLNGAADLPIASNGGFVFEGSLASGTAYRVTVRTSPTNPAQACTTANASGVIASTNVANVRITCATQTHSVRGTVSGLLGKGLVLQNNGADTLNVASNGSFVFATPLARGASYNVTVFRQPADPPQACNVSNARGTIGEADVSNVVVACSTSDFTIGGVVQGLEGAGLVLRNNGADELTINANGGFAFDTVLPPGATYAVTIADQPRDPVQTCTISNGAGVVGFANVTSVSVRCTTSGFEVGGRVSHLRGSGLVLQNNGADDLAIASNGRYRFATSLPTGSPYNVSVARQPSDPSQICEVRHGSGTIRRSNVRDVDVECRGGDDDDDD